MWVPPEQLSECEPQRDPVAAAAEEYAARGWQVLPVHHPGPDGICSCANGQCSSPGKHPRTARGFKDATTDLETIRAWFARWPNSNVAIRTGSVSGLVVLDVDPRNRGLESLAQLTREHGQLPDTVVAATGGGGFHYYFAYPAGLDVRKRTLADGIDLCSDGGYVIVAPSLHPSGRLYDWLVAPGRRPLAPSLDWFIDRDTASSDAITRPRDAVGADGAIPEGRRHTTLVSLAGTMRRRGFSEPAIRAALLEHNREHCAPPLDEAEVVQIARGVARYAPSAIADEHLTDLGNARRLVELHGRDLHWIPTMGWLFWNERHWERDETGEVERRAKDVVAALWELADQLEDAEEAEIIRKFAAKSEQGQRLREIVKVAQSESAMPLRVDDLDADPWLLNVRNGTLDLRTGDLREHRREDLITKLAPVDYAPDTPAPRWSAFLNEIFKGNAELISYVRRAVGYSISGLTTEQVLFIAYGTGANGKSTLLEAIRAALGDYSQQAPPDFLAARRLRGIPNDVARLRGSRFVTSVELEQGAQLADSLVKLLTGGDTVAARFLYREFFEFRPVGKFWIGTNHRPKISGSDYAMWRRIRLIPFSVRIPPAKQDRQLLAKLRGELPGILAWAVSGCLEWQQEGLGDPDEVREATEEYREEMDPVGRFLAELCVIEDRAACEATPLYRRFVHWAEQANEQVLSQTAYGREMSERGFARDNKGKGGLTRYLGIRLKELRVGMV